MRCDDNYLRDDAMRCDAMMDDENVAPYYRVGFTLYNIGSKIVIYDHVLQRSVKIQIFETPA